MQTSQPPPIQPAPAAPLPHQPQQQHQQHQLQQPQQQYQQAPAPPPAHGGGSQGSIPMQHTQYAPQPQNHVQGTTYQPQQQQQQQQQHQQQYQQQQQQQQYQPQQQQQYQPQQQLAPQPMAPAPGQHQQYHQQQQQQQQQPPQQQYHQQQQQQPPQQAFTQGLNGGWQSDQDYNERRKMIAKIVHLLKQRKPNAPQDWLKKLPQMAKRLEESLYRSAKDFNEYNDASTLKFRLQQLAHSIGMKTKRIQQAQMARAQQQQQQVQQPPQHQQQQAPQMGQVQYRPLSQQQQQPIAPMQPQPIQPNQPISQQQGQRIVNVAEINPIMGVPQQQQQQQPPLQMQIQTQQMQYQPQSAPAAPLQQPIQQQPGAALGPNGVRSAPPGARQVSDRQQVLRHQQQRLLLLRHAAKCQHEDGKCPVTPHCAGMKRLWKHIAECKDQKCLVPHCVSSRYVLSHYHRCKDVRCPVCGPVREAIHRSHEKQKQMQALKQRHQQAVQQAQQPVGITPQPIHPAPGVPSIQPVQYEPPNKRQRTSLPSQYQQQPDEPGLQPMQPQPYQSQPVVAGTLTQAAAPGQPYAHTQTGPPQKRGSKLTVQTKPMIAAAPGVKFANGQVITPKFTGPKPQEDHTLINCFSIDQIETHIASLNNGLQLTPQKLKTKCLEVLKVLQGHQHGWVFNSPVDPVELGLPDYFEVIKKPMDLGTIRKKLENNCYHSLEEFEGHVHLTFDNAMLYNPEGSVVFNMAKEMKDKFIKDFEVLRKQLHEEEDAKRRNGEACSLCGCEKLLFEPPVFYCNGANCPSKRIRRNAYYFVGGNNQYHWCQQCFNDLKPNQLLELGDLSIRKEALLKKKNDELHEESWVQCDRCERWVHQICALFNTRQNKDQRSEFACPRCTIEERKKTGRPEATSTTPMAEELQRTKLSEFLESHVRQKMDEHLEQLAARKVEKEKITEDEAMKAVEMGGAITIRQVTSMDRKLEVRERMKKRYAFKNYPDEFSYRCKCIVVFQNLDGVDVILFGLYVYEHDEKNPAPNTRTVYVSYLDSVHYMRPRSMRTFIYHEILISYLDYVRRRGFSTAHIWACPPLKGDDYILYAKPEDQKTPKDDRLRQWYVDMLVECQRRGIVGKVTNMYDLYFSNKDNDATIVPYMEGDYFPAEVENIIKELEEGPVSKKKNGKDGKKKGDKKQKKKGGGRGGTRSSGIDEDALKASGVEFPGIDQKSLEDGGRDYVMAKLGETIQPMKESFLVAYLAWKGAEQANMMVPKAIEEYRQKHNITTNWESSNDAGGESLNSADQKPETVKSQDSTDASNEKEAKPSSDPSSIHIKEAESEEMPMDTSSDNPVEQDADRNSANLGERDVTSNAAEEPSDEVPPTKKTKIDDPEVPDMLAATASAADESAKDKVRPDESTKEKSDTNGQKAENQADNFGPKDASSGYAPDTNADPASDNKNSKTDTSKEEQDAPMVDAHSEENNTEEKPKDKNDEKLEEQAEDKLDEKPEEKVEEKSEDIPDVSSEKNIDKTGDDSETKDGKDSANHASTDSKPDNEPEKDLKAVDAGDDSKKDEPEEESARKEESDPGNDTKNCTTAGNMETSMAPGAPNDDAKTPAETQADKNETVVSSGGEKKEDGEPAQPDSLKSDFVASGSTGSGPAVAPSDSAANANAPTPSSTEDVIKPKLSVEQRSGKFAAMAKKRPNPVVSSEDNTGEKVGTEKEGSVKEEDAKVVKDTYVTDTKGRRVKVIDDDAEEMDCEFLNNRQAFLNLCQGNHYQFDQLRRAKHTSMMVLWHLHNRDAPKFVSQCATCSREILQGYRMHCPTCADFDQCQECYQSPSTQKHPHPLKAIPVTGQAQELTAEQRRERQRSIQLHMTLLQHAATCSSPTCPSANCAKMKGLLKHGSQCKIKAAGGCSVCKRIWALLQIHARQCKQEQCPVPNCMAIRERVRQLKKQQQAMDDRRRQEMNRAYRGAR